MTAKDKGPKERLPLWKLVKDKKLAKCSFAAQGVAFRTVSYMDEHELDAMTLSEITLITSRGGSCVAEKAEIEVYLNELEAEDVFYRDKYDRYIHTPLVLSLNKVRTRRLSGQKGGRKKAEKSRILDENGFARKGSKNSQQNEVQNPSKTPSKETPVTRMRRNSSGNIHKATDVAGGEAETYLTDSRYGPILSLTRQYSYVKTEKDKDIIDVNISEKTKNEADTPPPRAPSPWGLWIDAVRASSFYDIDPLPLGPDLKAAMLLIKSVESFSRLKELYAAYLADRDAFVVSTGHQLRLLPARILRYSNGNSPMAKSRAQRIKTVKANVDYVDTDNWTLEDEERAAKEWGDR